MMCDLLKLPYIQPCFALLNENPINYLLIVAVVILFIPLLALIPTPRDSFKLKRPPNPIPTHYSQGYSWLPEKHPPSRVWTSFTPKSLKPFDGQNGGPILFAIRGKVYDVTAGRNFYGPDGPYGNFAGRDASRGLAKQSFDEDMLAPIDGPIDPLDDLTPSDWDNLRDWEMHFKGKYIMCGDFGPEK